MKDFSAMKHAQRVQLAYDMMSNALIRILQQQLGPRQRQRAHYHNQRPAKLQEPAARHLRLPDLPLPPEPLMPSSIHLWNSGLCTNGHATSQNPSRQLGGFGHIRLH
jgi:hypothetical protein